MSESDSFINEVTEEVRRDRLFRLFRKYGWIGILAVIVAVGGSAWYEWQRHEYDLSSQAFGDDLTAALQADDALPALQGLKATGSQAALVRMAEAAALARDGKTEAAMKAFDDVAADDALPQSLRDLAALKAVIVGGDRMPADKRKAALSDLAVSGRPYRPLAMEQQVVDLLRDGDKAGAIARARQILAEQNVTPGLQQRIGELIVIMGGDPTPAVDTLPKPASDAAPDAGAATPAP